MLGTGRIRPDRGRGGLPRRALPAGSAPPGRGRSTPSDTLTNPGGQALVALPRAWAPTSEGPSAVIGGIVLLTWPPVGEYCITRRAFRQEAVRIGGRHPWH